MPDHMRTQLAVDALTIDGAARDGHPALAGVIAHADRGNWGPLQRLPGLLPARQLRSSVGKTGIWDNAGAESFWKSLK